jgi:hypothetical protein
MNLKIPDMVSDHIKLQSGKKDEKDKIKESEKLNDNVSVSKHAETPIEKIRQRQKIKKMQSE